MKTHVSSCRRVLFALGLAAILVPAVTALAPAQCVYTELEAYVPHLFSPATGSELFQFEQTRTNWMAIATRPTPGFTPQVLLYHSMAAHPACVADLLVADEQLEGVSVVVGNFNLEPAGTIYGILDEVQAPAAVPVEWDAGSGSLAINDSMLFRTMDVNDLVDVWDVYLEAGYEYGFQVREISGDGLSVLLFEQTGFGPSWENRNGAALEWEVTGPLHRYTPTVSDYYGVVVVKDSAEAVTYGIAAGRCVIPSPLASGVSVHPHGYENYYEFNQQWSGWTAVGMRDEEGSQELTVYGLSAGREYPTCYTDVLKGVGAVGAVSLVRHFPTVPGTHILRASPSSDSTDPTLEWEGQGGTLTVNGPPVTRDTGPADVLEIWGVDLVAGENYAIHFDHVGQFYPDVLLFTPNATEWRGHDQAEVSEPESFEFSAAETGSHALVVINTDAKYGQYKLGVSSCSLPQTLSTGGNIRPTPTGETSARFRFHQDEPRWAGVAINSASDWDIDLYEDPTGGAEPVCFSGFLAASAQPGEPTPIDFVVGDFNRNDLGEYYVHAGYVGEHFTEAEASWDGGWGNLLLELNASGSLNSSHVIDIWDAPMIAGNEYQIHFERTSGTGVLELFVFEPSGESYWAGRGDHTLATLSSTTFTPAITGSYGFVVVNDTEGPAGYDIGISSATVSAQPGMATAGIHSLIPNPTTGSITINFGVANSQPVSFDIIDVAGRVIARLPVENEGAGSWSRSWNGLASQGTRPSPGVYFVRMRTGEEIIGTRKFVLIE